MYGNPSTLELTLKMTWDENHYIYCGQKDYETDKYIFDMFINADVWVVRENATFDTPASVDVLSSEINVTVNYMYDLNSGDELKLSKEERSKVEEFIAKQIEFNY